jgi:hypothetical protein
MIAAEEAADIARRHGLRLADAVSLRVLCDTADEAERVAARFAGTHDPEGAA